MKSEITPKPGAKSGTKADPSALPPFVTPPTVFEIADENPHGVFGFGSAEEMIDLTTPQPKAREILRGLLSSVFGVDVADDWPTR